MSLLDCHVDLLINSLTIISLYFHSTAMLLNKQTNSIDRNFSSDFLIHPNGKNSIF